MKPLGFASLSIWNAPNREPLLPSDLAKTSRFLRPPSCEKGVVKARLVRLRKFGPSFSRLCFGLKSERRGSIP
jgi:hypothetical protein